MNMQQPGAPEGLPASSTVTQRPYPELSNWAILWSGVVLLVIGAALVTVLLIAFGSGEHSSQLDAIKTAGTVVLGTGGAAALWLTARRQRSAEIALNQKHLDQAAVDRAFTLQQQTAEENRRHQERVAVATEHDAAQRRLSELYLKAVEQLGSDKAAVRHGGLYALERVAQDNPEQQQTVVNVLCAYLRAPFTASGTSSTRRLGVRRPLLASRGRATAISATASKSAYTIQRDTSGQVQQEHEVRLTAQRILETHLKPGPDRDSPVLTFWPNINLDLTGAALSGLDLADCLFNDARFDNAELLGKARFEHAEFAGYAGFGGVKFAGTAGFGGVKFAGNAEFGGAEFAGNAIFVGVKFAGYAGFDRAEFAGDAGFDRAEFAGDAEFEHAEFAGDSGFGGAEFAGDAGFGSVKFAGHAGFGGVRFAGDAWFGGAEFMGQAEFGGVRFAGYARFGGAEFAEKAKFQHAELTGNIGGFIGAKFAGTAGFEHAEFAGDAWFGSVKFAGKAKFEHAEFAGNAGFEAAEFAGDAGFGGVKFAGDAKFVGAEFAGDAGFEHAEFARDAWFGGVRFARDAKFERTWVSVTGDEFFRSWPAGWAPPGSHPVPREGKLGLWIQLTAVPSAPEQNNSGEQ